MVEKTSESVVGRAILYRELVSSGIGCGIDLAHEGSQGALSNDAHLGHESGSVCESKQSATIHRTSCSRELTFVVASGIRALRLSEALRLELLNLALDGLELLGLEPKISPIGLSDHASRTGTDSLEHVLGRVGVVRAVSAVLGKVRTNVRRVCIKKALAEVSMSSLIDAYPFRCCET